MHAAAALITFPPRLPGAVQILAMGRSPGAGAAGCVPLAGLGHEPIPGGPL